MLFFFFACNLHLLGIIIPFESMGTAPSAAPSLHIESSSCLHLHVGLGNASEQTRGNDSARANCTFI